MHSTSPFASVQIDNLSQRQRAIAVLIQHIWDQTNRTIRRDADQSAHRNQGVPQSKLPPIDRWANDFSAVFLDQWINAYASRFGGLQNLSPGSQGEHRAAHMLFMLWSIARFGPEAQRTKVRRQPASIQDIPNSHLALMEKWWKLSLDSISKCEVDRQLEESFPPTCYQALLDRCIARAAISCQKLSECDLGKIANEQDIKEWADGLGGLTTTCEILRRQAMSSACPTILITGPTSTGKSWVAWKLAQLIKGVVIAADPFQICAVPPIGLGVGLPSHLPPPGVRTQLYRSRTPGIQRPSPDMITDCVIEAVNHTTFHGLPRIIEGCSISSAVNLWERGIPSHVVVFNAEPRDAKFLVQTRMSRDRMGLEDMLAEARAVRASGLEPTWVAQESVIYPKLFQVLDQQTSRGEAISSIQSDWERLILDQQEWFDELRALDGVIALSPSRHSARSILQLFEFEELASLSCNSQELV